MHLHEFCPALDTTRSDFVEDLLRELGEDVNRDVAVERGLDRRGMALPLFSVREDDVWTTKEREVKVLLVVFLRKARCVHAYLPNKLQNQDCQNIYNA